MSLKLLKLWMEDGAVADLTRDAMLSLHPERDYSDGRTKQCHKDECDISKIMARFAQTGTISHVAKYEGVYGDYSDFDFHTTTRRLAQGNEVFASLDAEIRREFGQDPQRFFDHVNDPANAGQDDYGLPALAKPGTQLPGVVSPTADHEAALAAQNAPMATPAPTAGIQPAASQEPD